MSDPHDLFRQPSNNAEVVEGDDVDPFLLRRFGFDSSVLLRAVSAGHADAAMTTKHSPATAFGSRFWEGSIRQLRDDLAPQGWKPLRPGQLEVSRNMTNSAQITTALGDANVGNLDASPSCEHPRGVSTAKAVEVNESTFAGIAPSNGWAPIETWWLMYRPSSTQDVSIRSEFSLPVSMAGAKIDEWAIRVILPTSPDEFLGAATLPEAPSPIDVPIARRLG